MSHADGQSTFTAVYVDGQYAGFTIDQADPEILVDDELLTKIAAGDGGPGVNFDGDVLTLTGINRTVSYRITGMYSTGSRTWLADRIDTPRGDVL